MKPFLLDYFQQWWAERKAIANYKPIMKPGAVLPSRIVRIALTKVDLKESPSGSNRGPEIQEFFDADSYDPNGTAPGDSGYAWCAAFVCRIIQLAMGDDRWTFARPTTPAAWGFESWSLNQDTSTRTIRKPGRAIEPGDVVMYTFSHVGIAITAPNEHGYFLTVEGNTNTAGEREGTVVATKRRHISEVRSVVRFTV